MLSGRRLDILDPSPLDIEIEDIAHGLARVARWNGQTEGAHPFSVAQHSCLVEAIAVEVEPTLQRTSRLAALLHDAPEYVVGDLISPFKAAIGTLYREVEARLEQATHLRFSIPPDPDGSRRRFIKAADTVAAYHEAVALAGFSPQEAGAIFGKPDTDAAAFVEFLTPWTTAVAEDRFLTRFRALERGD
ncbi:MAG: HD family hydrolase [Pseudomonadota bacterium]